MWTEGLFLTPQHLQAFDGYHEQLLERRLATLSPHLWGITELQLDNDELARGVIKVSELSAIMPDGVVVQLSSSAGGKGLSRTTPASLRQGEKLGLYLGIPPASAGGASPAGQSGGTRYVEETQSYTDTFGIAEDVELQCVRPNIQLLFDGDQRQGYVTLKIAELALSDAGRPAISERYFSPMMRIGSAKPLMELLKRLAAALGAKQRELASRYSDRSAAMVEYGAADVSTFWYLHTVNSWLPVVMHHADSGATHPEQLYLALVSLAGQLSTFDPQNKGTELPRYRHADPAGTFLPLFERVLYLVSTVVSNRYTPISLEQTQPGLFVGRFESPGLLGKALYLVAGGEISEEALREDLPRYLKVGSLDQIAHIVQSALPGVTARIDMAPPNAIPIRSHMLYLRLDKLGGYWDAIEQSATIAIYQPVKPGKVQLELLAVDV